MTEEEIQSLVRGPFTPNGDGTIDCEFNNPVVGWVPFTASADDVEEHGRLIHAWILTQI